MLTSCLQLLFENRKSVSPTMLLFDGDFLCGVILVPGQGEIGPVVLHGDLTQGLHLPLVHHSWFLSMQHQGTLGK